MAGNGSGPISGYIPEDNEEKLKSVFRQGIEPATV
jgi:hypothetical protein